MQIRRADQTAPLRVMCLGDSVTDGFWLAGGYRNTLCDLIAAGGLQKCFTFVGPHESGSGYAPRHAGFTGYSIADIAQCDSVSGARSGLTGLAPQLTVQYPADVILLMIGTNDILSLYDLNHFGERLNVLADILLNALPVHGRLYLASLPGMDVNDPLYISPDFFTADSMDEAVAQCNVQILALVQKKQAAGRPIAFADAGSCLTKSDLRDGVHPTAAGYEKLGRFWYRILTEYRSTISDCGPFEP